MKFLVLGSSGLVGGALINKLHQNKHEIIPFDIKISSSQDLRIHNNVLLDKYVKKCDFVFFLACDIGGAKYISTYQNSFDFIHNNISILKETFETINKYKKPFIFSSSEMATMNYSAYGCIKAVGEYYSKSLDSPIVRFWNIYGVEPEGQKSHVITDFIMMAKKNHEIKMMTNGEEERQFLFADDCAECLEIIANNYNSLPRDKEIHIAGFKWYKILEVAQEVAKNYPGTTIIPGANKDLTHQSIKYEPNKFITKYWKPKTSLSQGISNICQIYNER
ncbi:MAG TPA: NAD(P)-dependent oxidoreductase [Methanofastidiosum sp.]|nr:NAD(P)-dependent oxidoreductase [Methanofastidiosum sp.]